MADNVQNAVNITEKNNQNTNMSDFGIDSTEKNQLINKLLEQSGVVAADSEGDTETISGLIDDQISRIEKAGEERETGIEAGAERRGIEIREAGQKALTSTLESRRGFATNTAVIRQIKEDTNKTLNDLELRKQEALAQGAMEEAQNIANLEIQALQFEQQTKQQAFSNLINFATLELQQERERRLGEQQTFQEKQAMSNIALEYGIDLKQGDTFSDVVARAKDQASIEQSLQLEALRQQINASKAQEQEALAKIKNNDPLSENDIIALAEMADTRPEFLSQLNPQQYIQVARERRQMDKKEISNLEERANQYDTATEFIEAMNQSPLSYSATNVNEAALNVFGTTEGKKGADDEDVKSTPLTRSGREQAKQQEQADKDQEIQQDLNDVSDILNNVVEQGSITIDDREKLKDKIQRGFLGFISFRREKALRDKYGDEGFKAINKLMRGNALTNQELNEVKRAIQK